MIIIVFDSRIRIAKGAHTVEQMLGKGVIGHILGDKKPLIAVAAVPDQVRQPPVPQLPHSPCLLLQ